MKEFIVKHPIISFLLADAAIGGIVKVVQAVSYAISGRPGLAPYAYTTRTQNPDGTMTTTKNKDDADKEIKEENKDDSTGDIQ